jgi:hypothetical protein
MRFERKSERGGALLKTILAVCIVGGMIFTGIKVVPAYMSNYELQDSIQTAARFAMANRRTPDDLKDQVFKKVRELGLNVRRDDIQVTIAPDGFVSISLSYSVPVDLPGYQFQLQFHPHADNRSI